MKIPENVADIPVTAKNYRDYLNKILSPLRNGDDIKLYLCSAALLEALLLRAIMAHGLDASERTLQGVCATVSAPCPDESLDCLMNVECFTDEERVIVSPYLNFRAFSKATQDNAIGAVGYCLRMFIIGRG